MCLPGRREYCKKMLPLTLMRTEHIGLFLFIMKFVQLGTQIKHNVKKKKIYKNAQKAHYEVHKTIS